MFDWITHNISGWQYTLPGAFVTAIAVALLYRAARPKLASWAILVPWAVVVLLMYDHYRVRDVWLQRRELWYPVVIDLLVVGLLPFLSAWGVTALTWKRRPQVAIAAAAGGIATVIALPLIGTISRLMARVLLPLFL